MDSEKFSDYMENGQLYRNLGHRADDEYYFPCKLCVPSSNRVRVLQECHDAPTAGHLGVRKTVSRLSQRYFWPGMFRDAKRYVQRCESCQKFRRHSGNEYWSESASLGSSSAITVLNLPAAS